MKNIKNIITPVLILFSIALFGQTENQAIEILDSFSAKALAAPSVSMNFDIRTEDQMDSSDNNSLSGSIILSKDSYRLELPDNIIWFNGTTVWSFLPAEKEVTINVADEEDDSFQNKPSKIFTEYKNAYKIRVIEEKPDYYIIDLYPEDINSELIRIRLSIGRPDLNLKSLEYKKKDGIVITLKVKDYNLTIKPDQNTFIYQSGLYKGVEVIDLR